MSRKPVGCLEEHDVSILDDDRLCIGDGSSVPHARVLDLKDGQECRMYIMYCGVQEVECPALATPVASQPQTCCDSLAAILLA